MQPDFLRHQDASMAPSESRAVPDSGMTSRNNRTG
jgi:hypothetical protein